MTRGEAFMLSSMRGRPRTEDPVREISAIDEAKK